MNLQKLAALGTAFTLLFGLTACQSADSSSQTSSGPERALVLSDEEITLDGQTVTEDSQSPVTVSHDIIYYQSGMGSDYGEGSEDEAHSAEEAQAHTVVTIRQPGTYRVSGALSPGQLAVDLGEDAKTDPNAVVTLILDGVDITCTVAPAVIFYNVYECDTQWVACQEDGTEDDYDAPSTVDTSAAGANVILADDSDNTVQGSHVARIYQEGTTKKLHKYDGAFYSRMSMNISGETEGTGTLNITADNEGLDSELHLTINGGTINIQSQDDGINTNEDGVSVTTINGGTLQINAGLGTEGDGIDSNGYLVINGGNVYTMANEKSPDGGLDADKDIIINGGYVVALGVRNDAVSQQSGQQYGEFFFASTLPAGTIIELSDAQGEDLLQFSLEKAAQCLTFSSPDLAANTTYTLKVDGVIQQYTGNSFGGMGGGPRPGDSSDGDRQPPDGEPPAGHQQPPEGETPDGQPPERPDDGQGPQQPGSSQAPDAGSGQTEGSTEFTLSDSVHTFSGISASAQDSGKTQVTFSADVSVAENGTVTVENIQCSQELDPSHVQISIADVPSENYAASCLLSDGEEALADILPTDPGTYQLTIAVANDSEYTGASQFSFTIPQS